MEDGLITCHATRMNLFVEVGFPLVNLSKPGLKHYIPRLPDPAGFGRTKICSIQHTLIGVDVDGALPWS